MRRLLLVFTLLFPLSGAVFSQTWEVGASAGYSNYRHVNVTAPGAAGKTGFARGFAFGALLGNDINNVFGGEVRYTYRAGDLRVSSGSTKAQANGESHAIHYDVLVHATGREAPIRPFFAVGAGVRYYRGTGAEPAFQPLSNLVILTHTNQAEPLISVGGGVKFRLSRRILFRLDFRDYATPVPDKLLASPSGVRLGWGHDLLGMAGISAIL